MTDMTEKLPFCSFRRRLLVILYDALLFASIAFCFTLFVVIFGGGEAIDGGNLVYHGFLFLVCCLYYCWHWVSGRQTLGMRAWRVRIVGAGDENLAWCGALLRFFCAVLTILPCGLGLFWGLANARRQCLYERLSGTRLVRVAG